MCEKNNTGGTEWETLGKGRFLLLQNQYGEYSLWLESQDGFRERYSMEKLEEWMNLALEQGVVNDGNIKLSRSFTFRPKEPRVDLRLSAEVPDENRHSSQDNLPTRQAQQYFDNEYVGK